MAQAIDERFNVTLNKLTTVRINQPREKFANHPKESTKQMMKESD